MIEKIGHREYELPKPLPQNWRQLSPNLWRSRTGLAVICSIEKRDGDDWLHVSFSKKIKGKPNVPSYQEMMLVKELFVGTERYAYMVAPPASEHVNIHPNALHWWCSLTNPRPLPEFSNELLGMKAI